MKWLQPKETAIGTTRIVWRFLWRPICLPVGDAKVLEPWTLKRGLTFSKEYRWLWFYRIKQKYLVFTDGFCNFEQWENVCWADEDCPLNWR
jgi:hypothetical protein